MTDATVTVRAARPDEAEWVVPSYEWLFEPPGSRPVGWDPTKAADRLRTAAGDDGSEVFVADRAGEIVGLCTVYLDIDSVRFGRRAWVEDLAVHPGARSLGIGKRLLDAAKDWGRERGASHLELDSGDAREDAQRFYEREGPTSRSRNFGWDL
jgi:GNAT superfamily N-acetyltransferase